MRKILCVLVCLGALFGAQPYKILGLVPFGDHNLKIVFNQDIATLKLDEKKLQDGRVFVDIESILAVPKKSFAFKDNSIINVAQNTPKIVRIVLKPTKDYRLHKEAHNLYIRMGEATSALPALETQAIPTSTTKKKIVIDPGHGGKDCGAMGVARVCEKEIVLEVAKYLQTELKKRGYITYMTRDSDKFIDLIDRTKFANDKGADLFISIHANSIPVGRKSPSGIETYFLSTNRSQKALKVAEAENIGDIATMNYFSKQTFLHTINNHRLIASSKLAVDIQSGMVDSVRKKYKNIVDGGVKDGPFWVLAGALMPSVLIEIGYVSHQNEGKLLTTSEYQKLLANGIADGIEDYLDKN
ncbi:N-acetylmuramoyl-L-alanine amidase [uncultured Helicobacter sp.]|uniref:N-acetylmuramoyl-L-alanine amidase family protein n=2 Tax=uncultured Helicobacter sp. TaxID=175537 RepID=UPI001C3BBB95|nr:N-acetylmuramoyl-L-alanine amidase [Candidatus Helicobacter avicola]